MPAKRAMSECGIRGRCAGMGANLSARWLIPTGPAGLRDDNGRPAGPRPDTAPVAQRRCFQSLSVRPSSLRDGIADVYGAIRAVIRACPRLPLQLQLLFPTTPLLCRPCH